MTTRPIRRRTAAVLTVVALVGGLLLGTGTGAALAAPRPTTPAAAAPQEPGGPPPGGANDWTCRPSAAHPRPVVLVHGLGATMVENWGYLSPILHDAGYCVFALTYGMRPDFPYMGGLLPMEQSAQELDAFVTKVLAATGASQIDLVGHSEGTVMPQWWLKKLGGAPKTHAYVALTPLYDGTTLYGMDRLLHSLERLSPAFAAQGEAAFAQYCGSCTEFLRGSPFLQELYGDGVVAAPGVTYTTIMTKLDEVVVPWSSGRLDSPQATNIVLQQVCPLHLNEHVMVAVDPVVARLVLNALDPAHAGAPSCGPLVGLGLGPLQL